MGGSESTGRSNGAENEEDKQRQRQSSGVSTGAAKAITVVAAGAAVAAAAWGISRMLSDKEKDDAMPLEAHSGSRQSLHSSNPKAQELERSLPNPKIRGHMGYGRDIQPTIGYRGIGMWRPPPPGRFKMNTDGISRPNPGPSAYAGILRDDRGEWVRGFIGFLGDAEILIAEICGIYQGLRLLIKLKKKGSILESDSHEAVCWTTRKNKSYENPTEKMAEYSTIITECWRLARENNISIIEINGDDANQCADELAELALRLEQKYLEIEKIPYEIKNLVDKESLNSI